MKEIIKICIKHGSLTKELVIKSRINSKGKRTYRCKICMKIQHKNHYEKNKLKILSKNKKYFDEHPDFKNRSKRKMYKLNPKKYIAKSVKWDKENRERKKDRQKKFKTEAVSNLFKSYVKQTLVRGTNLMHKDLSDELVNLAKAVFTLKRKIKNDT